MKKFVLYVVLACGLGAVVAEAVEARCARQGRLFQRLGQRLRGCG